LPGSGAGSNLLSGFLLENVNANTVPLTSITALTSYGTFGPGGSDSGGFAVDIRGFKAFKFQMLNVGAVPLAGYGVSIYATVDPNAYQTYQYALQGRNPQGNSALPFGGSPNALGSAALGFLPGIPPQSWSLLDGLSDQSGAGLSANPLTPSTPWFTGNGPIIGLRAVLTASSGAAGTFNLSVLGIP
jgi:hypothetical protein